MGTESIQVSGVINASADQIYDAWLDAHQHSKFTGGTATVDPGIGGKFTAWDGYIQGTTLELEPGRRIVQAWRTTEFPPESPDSRLEVVFEPIGDATRVTLRHSEIPEGQGGRYEQGWKEHYLTRMTKFFGEDEVDDAVAEDSLLSEVLPPPIPVEVPAKLPKPKVEKAPATKAATPKKASAKPKSSPKPAKVAKKKPAKKVKKKAKKKSGKKSAKTKSTKKSSKKAKKSTRSKKRR
jgi:uncharacterized protein YndB with AHSA1/START domain